MTMILGIDPGLTGALALVDDLGDLRAVWDMPTQAKRHGKGQEVNPYILADLVREAAEMAGDNLGACLERVAAMPGQGVSSTFAFGAAYGVVRGVLGACLVRVDYVTPQAWKRHHGLLRRSKDASRSLALEKWPHMREHFARKKDCGRADAALIAQWAVVT